MIYQKSIFAFALLSILLGCYASKTTTSQSKKETDIQYTSLVQLLRGKPGLKINGFGEDITVVIRGERSFLENNEPLYMLDDVVIGNSYREASTGIDPTAVTSVDIITPANAGRFGGRGGNGVIIFRSRKGR